MGADREPRVVAEYATEFEANLVKNMLREAGVPCETMGGMLAGFRAEAPGMVRLLVPAAYEGRALELLIAHDAARGSASGDGADGCAGGSGASSGEVEGEAEGEGPAAQGGR